MLRLAAAAHMSCMLQTSELTVVARSHRASASDLLFLFLPIFCRRRKTATSDRWNAPSEAFHYVLERKPACPEQMFHALNLTLNRAEMQQTARYYLITQHLLHLLISLLVT